jgi:hypothetical protein
MIPGIGLFSRGPRDFAGGQLGGDDQTTNRININGKPLPLFADTHIHNNNKPFDRSRIQAIVLQCPAKR